VYVSAGFFFNREQSLVLLHLRDQDAEVHPGMWSTFGGHSEPDDGDDPIAAWLREVPEELGVLLDRSDVRPVPGVGSHPGPVGVRHFFAEWADTSQTFELTEGRALAWFGIDEALALEILSDFAMAALTHFRDSLEREQGSFDSR
jgi:8-oxo-dGTP pyrophosphatase MutT (NUDIX family)